MIDAGTPRSGYDPASILTKITAMATTRVSRKYQVVIPKAIREGLSIRPGQEMQVIRKGNVITLIPDRPISAYRGILRGLATTGYREKEGPLLISTKG
jgi:AbrB family looped-hinge helix DNA binding protein